MVERRTQRVVNPTLLRLADIARAHHGVVSRGQARHAGASAVQIHRWVASARLERVGERSLSFPGQPADWLRSLQIALNDLGGSAAISHRSAARLHGIAGFEGDDVDITMPREQRNRVFRGGVLHSCAPPLKGLDLALARGFRCTSATRTIIDLASVCTRSELENAVDSAVHLRLISLPFLRKRLAAHRGSGRSGVRLLDEVLIDGGGVNHLERRFLAICRLAGLPRPAVQVPHRIDGKVIARVDFDFSPSCLVVEVDGQIAHASPRQRQHAAQRRRDLNQLGRVVYTFTHEDVFHRPEVVASQVRSGLTMRSRHA